MGIGEIEGFRTRVRVYDYGVVSVALQRPFDGSWPELVGLGQALIENPELEQRAEQLCRAVIDRLRPALLGVRDTFLSEDYVVFTVNALGAPLITPTSCCAATAKRSRRCCAASASR